MEDLILKTIIFIIKDKETGEPIVISHFQGFSDNDEAIDFSKFLQDQFVEEPKVYDSQQNFTLH